MEKLFIDFEGVVFDYRLFQSQESEGPSFNSLVCAGFEEAMKKLSAKYEISVLTARQGFDNLRDVEIFLEYLGLEKVILKILSSEGIPKMEVLESYCPCFMVDDNDFNLLPSNSGIKTFLLDLYGVYSQHKVDSSITYASSWEEITRIIL